MKPTNDRVFIDTNVLVYLYSGDESAKRAAAMSALGNGTACLTTQVLSELAHVLTKKFRLQATSVQAVVHEVCDACEVHPVTPELIVAALRLRDQYRYGFYDSLIIAGARGASMIKGLLVGSVADRLLKEARCSVLLVH